MNKLPSYAKSDKFIGRGLSSFGLKTRLLKEITKRKLNHNNLNLLEVGCGQGNFLLDLLSLFPHLKLAGLNKDLTHGIKNQTEIKNRAIQRGLKTKNLPKIYFGDATKLPFASATFDLVISQVTFLHIKNKAQAIEEIYRVLKIGGTALVSLGSYSIRRKRGHAMPLFYRSLRRKLGADFNPRFLIKTASKFIPLSKFIQGIKMGYGIELQTAGFVSDSQRGFAQWIILNKKNKRNLALGLKYNAQESRKLTGSFSKKTPLIGESLMFINWLEIR